MAQLIAAEEGESVEKGVLAYVEIIDEPKAIERLRARLERLLADLQKDDAPGGAGGPPRPPSPTARRFRLTLAFFPLDRSDSGKKARGEKLPGASRSRRRSSRK
jgi:hypothetical protein